MRKRAKVSKFKGATYRRFLQKARSSSQRRRRVCSFLSLHRDWKEIVQSLLKPKHKLLRARRYRAADAA